MMLGLLIQNECLSIAPVNAIGIRHGINKRRVSRRSHLVEDLKVVFDRVH